VSWVEEDEDEDEDEDAAGLGPAAYQTERGKSRWRKADRAALPWANRAGCAR
jgi:hypothetical protein